VKSEFRIYTLVTQGEFSQFKIPCHALLFLFSMDDQRKSIASRADAEIDSLAKNFKLLLATIHVRLSRPFVRASVSEKTVQHRALLSQHTV
jgi:hypothetical protein